MGEIQKLEVRRADCRNVMAQLHKEVGHMKRVTQSTVEQLQQKEESLEQVGVILGIPLYHRKPFNSSVFARNSFPTFIYIYIIILFFVKFYYFLDGVLYALYCIYEGCRGLVFLPSRFLENRVVDENILVKLNGKFFSADCLSAYKYFVIFCDAHW